jgi:hypothetical protein
MLRLVNPDGTRKPRTRAELVEGLASESGAALDRLLSQRLLVATHHEDTGEPLLELAHESLVTTWPQLSRWLAETQEARTLAREIEQAAEIWNKRGRREDETWANEALLDVLRRVQQWNVSLSSMPRDFLEAGRARQAKLASRRRLGVIGAFAAISLFGVGASLAALEFREKERQAIAQQELIRLAAGDVGRFELVLEPFDWDSKTLEKRAVDAAQLPRFDWRIYSASRSNPPIRGKELEPRRSERHVDEHGRLIEIVEIGSRSVFFEFIGRGDCGSSWLYVQALPGYAERQEPAAKLVVPVPTCAATADGLVRFSLPDAGSFAIDRTETTSEQWDVYGALSEFTGDQRSVLLSDFDQVGKRGLPLVGVNAFTADRFCAYFGRRLPSFSEWIRASQTHPQRTNVRTEGCKANLEGTDDGFAALAPVGSCTGDITEEGVVDLLGNVSEWLSGVDDEPGSRFMGLRNYAGSNCFWPADAPPGQLDYLNNAPPNEFNYGRGVRCASD